MMTLHEDKNLFIKLLTDTAEEAFKQIVRVLTKI